MIDNAILIQIMPSCKDPLSWVAPLTAATDRFAITTLPRLAAFLAQVAVESAELNRLSENLNYSAERLIEVWPKRFPNIARAKEFEHNPEKLANYVYADRIGNGEPTTGDGWNYRGRGILQITGRSNYGEVGRALGLPLESNPSLLEECRPAALAAALFWNTHGLNDLADRQTDSSFEEISTVIKGASRELEERKRYWERAKLVLK